MIHAFKSLSKHMATMAKNHYRAVYEYLYVSLVEFIHMKNDL